MERRSLLGAMIAAAVAGAADAQTTKRPIQLNCDLGVDPKNDDAFIKHLDTVFRPVAKKHEGYIDLKLLRLNTAIRGNVPNGCRFRFSLTFQSEALRQKWIASKDHEKVWAPIDAMLTNKDDFSILVYDVY